MRGESEVLAALEIFDTALRVHATVPGGRMPAGTEVLAELYRDALRWTLALPATRPETDFAVALQCLREDLARMG